MRKNLLSLALAAAMVMSVVACGGGGGGEGGAISATAAAEVAPAAPAPSSGGAAIAGVTTYENGDPDTEIKMDADPVCASLHPDVVHTEKIVHDGSGNLANVFVYIKEGLDGKSYPVPPTAHVLNQAGCQYSPHVSGMMVDQKLIIRNSDPTLHNVHAMPSANKEFNMGQPFQGMELEHTFDQAEVMVPFKCDVHPWMASYMAVLDHPFFAVSDTDGSYAIENVPAGNYVVEAWHEELGTQTQSVTVGDSGKVAASFDFSPAG